MRTTRRCCLILAVCSVAVLALLAMPALAESPTAPGVAFIELPGDAPGDPTLYRSYGGTTTLWLEPDALWLSQVTPDGKLDYGRIALANAPEATLEPVGPLETRFSFFFGNDPNAWRTHVRAWRGVRWRNVAPGVDIEISSRGGTPDFCFVTAESSCLSERQQAIAAVQWAIDPCGASPGILESLVNCLSAAEASSLATTSSSPYLVWSTLIPGSGSGTTNMILPPDQCPIVVGDSLALEFPTTPGAYSPGPSGSRDIWVCKLTPNGDGVIWATYIGGGRHESAPGLALGPTGDVYLAGDTASPNFPITPGAYDPDYGNLLYDSEAFCLRLASDASALIWSTYLGGEGYDWGRDVAVDDAGRAFVVGTSNSPDLAGTPGSLDPTHNGAYDAFLMALNADGGSLHYGALLGGTDDDGANGIALDASGNAYLVGSTTSSDFPTTPGAYRDALDHGGSVFVAKAAAGGGSLAYNTLVGQSTWYWYSNQFPGDIAVDSVGRAVIAGPTTSNGFPTTPGAYDTSPNGRGDAYVTRLSADGSALDASTLVGGSDTDEADKLAIDAQGNIIICGNTESTDLPTTADRILTAYSGGNNDGFVARLSPDLSALTYGTWLGGEGWDLAVGLGVAWSGDIVVAGRTASEGFPTTPGAWAEGLNGATGEAFVSRVRPATGGSVVSRVGLPMVMR